MYMGKLSQLYGKRKNNDDTSEKKRKRAMEAEGGNETAEKQRLPLSEVVSDCIKRWFQDTLKEANTGDINMQVLVGQMYYSGYGVAKDANKGKFWIAKASRIRSSVWKVSNKRPGELSMLCFCAHTIVLLYIFLLDFLLLLLYCAWKIVSLAGYNVSDSDSDESTCAS